MVVWLCGCVEVCLRSLDNACSCESERCLFYLSKVIIFGEGVDGRFMCVHGLFKR
jgi:hypothetical protein